MNWTKFTPLLKALCPPHLISVKISVMTEILSTCLLPVLNQYWEIQSWFPLTLNDWALNVPVLKKTTYLDFHSKPHFQKLQGKQNYTGTSSKWTGKLTQKIKTFFLKWFEKMIIKDLVDMATTIYHTKFQLNIFIF